MNYKKIFRNQELRFFILRLFDWVPNSLMVRLQYRIKMGAWPNFKQPKRFTEKIQLYKMKYRNPIMHQCVDKYEVRKYIETKNLSHILNELYGVYNKPEEIDFDSLPNKFVIKTTNGGGGLNVIVIKDKQTADINEILQKLSLWNGRKKAGSSFGREWAYEGPYHSRIIVEKFLEDSSIGGLNDYKFFCFNGVPYCVQVDSGRYESHHQNFYDMNWLSLGVHCTYPEGKGVEKPVRFEEMKRVVALLSRDFPFVRVDLYEVRGKIYFGELTFYPSSGYGSFKPDSFDIQLGSYFTEY